MHLWLGVKNFAKIESAKICIDAYTLLVGQNNTGKTFLMQLAYGIETQIYRLIEDDIEKILLPEHKNGIDRYTLSGENIGEFTKYLNQKLQLQKERIVRDIFGKDIPIEELYIEPCLDDGESYSFVIQHTDKQINKEMQTIFDEIGSLSKSVLDMPENSLLCVTERYDANNSKKESLLFSLTQNTGDILSNAISDLLHHASLFLPASRTGLMLLYRQYFANRTDDFISYKFSDAKFPEKSKERGDGLTRPTYDFLRFLQTYSENESRQRKYREELEFFEENLIEGHIGANQQGILSYCSKDDANKVPMYLVSSMINEIAPMMMAISSDMYCEKLVIDEVEASLHPEKQTELVRFLNRLSNKGIRLIISTHSDTFVSKMNNLYLLSAYAKENRNVNIEKKFGLDMADLVNPENLFVYEFVIQPNGKSIVKEIRGDQETGYQFDLFTGSAMRLYDEALKIGEMQQDDKC